MPTGLLKIPTLIYNFFINKKQDALVIDIMLWNFEICWESFVSSKMRVFISSTMDDLGNERRAVVAQLKNLNVEPVYAESFSPNGSTSWERIKEEVKDCQILVLLLGERYGWVPDEGPGSREKRSVTHMEALLARELGLIVLPFFKDLSISSTVNDESKARDKFRKEVSSWDKGYFRQTFKWADDLAESVAKAVSEALTQAFLREFRAQSAQTYMQSGGSSSQQPSGLHTIIAKASWVSPSAVLFAGAGMSIAAGYPTAASLSESLIKGLDLNGSENEPLFQQGLSVIADLYQQRFGRTVLLNHISNAMRPPKAFGPTVGHLAAVRVFQTIITTNYDQLFEKACQYQNIPYMVVTPDTCVEIKRPLNGCLILKLDGSIKDSDSLILTKRDYLAATGEKPLWNAAFNELERRPIIIVGSSLRDPSSTRVIDSKIYLNGAYVTPYLETTGLALLKRYDLTGVRADSDSFMISYEQALASRDELG